MVIFSRVPQSSMPRTTLRGRAERGRLRQPEGVEFRPLSKFGADRFRERLGRQLPGDAFAAFLAVMARGLDRGRVLPGQNLFREAMRGVYPRPPGRAPPPAARSNGRASAHYKGGSTSLPQPKHAARTMTAMNYFFRDGRHGRFHSTVVVGKIDWQGSRDGVLQHSIGGPAPSRVAFAWRICFGHLGCATWPAVAPDLFGHTTWNVDEFRQQVDLSAAALTSGHIAPRPPPRRIELDTSPS